MVRVGDAYLTLGRLESTCRIATLRPSCQARRALPQRWRRAVRPLAASEPSGSRIGCYRKVPHVLQNLAWLNFLPSVSKVLNVCCRGCSSRLSLSPPTAGLTRRSSGRSTAGHARLSPELPCRRCPPLTFNVRPPRRHMSHRYASVRSPIAKGAVAAAAPGCPSFGGQRAIRLSHRVLSQSAERASKSCMAQRSVQRLQCHQRSLPWSLVGVFTCAPHRRPNPSVKRTPNSGPRSAVFAQAVPLLAAAYLIR